MTTVHISIGGEEELKRRFLAAMAGKPQGSHLSFASIDLLWRVLAPKRWDILRVMTGQGPMALREIARRVGRDVKGVHTDVHALLKAGVVRRDETGRFVFPYDKVHVDFTVTAAA